MGGYFCKWLRYLLVDHIGCDLDLAAAAQQIAALVAHLADQGNLIGLGSEEAGAVLTGSLLALKVCGRSIKHRHLRMTMIHTESADAISACTKPPTSLAEIVQHCLFS